MAHDTRSHSTPSQAEGDRETVEETLRLQRARSQSVASPEADPRKEGTMGQKVKDVMNPGVEVVRPDDTVKHAAVMMEAHEVGPLPVCDGERLVGMLTDRDITIRAVAAGLDPSSTTVRETMTAEALAYVFEDQDVDEAVALMEERQVRRLPVVDREKRLVGILALADLARRADREDKARAVEGVSQPTETQGASR